MSFLDQPGDLAEVPLAAVLLEVLNSRATGVLTVDHGGGASRVFVRDGVPVGALSFTGFRPLGTLLLAQGHIDIEALGRSLAEMQRTGRPQGEVLVEMGAVHREVVNRALSEQQAGYLTDVAGLASGRFSFDFDAEIPAWTDGIRISPLKAIVDALERPQATPLVVAALQPAAGGALALARGYDELASSFGFTPPEEALVARMRGLVALEALLEAPDLAPERSRAIVSALLLLGLVGVRAPSAGVEPVPGLVVDLADLAGVPIEVATEPPASPTPAPRPLRRSDPEEARRRRQRLLQRAMQNMGIGPLSGQRPRPPPAAGGARDAPAAPAARAAASGPEAELRRALEEAWPQARSEDYFDRLGVPRGAGREEVKAAYFALAKRLHPDRFAAPALADVAPRVKDLFAALNEAYGVLSDDAQRAAYAARTGTAAAGDPASAAVDFKKAEACARTRDFGRARGFYEAALRADPRPEYAVAYAGVLLKDPRGDRTRARELAEGALKDAAASERAGLVLSAIARDAGDEAGARALLERVLVSHPRSAEARRELELLEARSRSRGSGLTGIFRKR